MKIFRSVVPIAAAVLVLTPPPALAQTQAGATALPRFDFTTSFGWYSANEGLTDPHQSWYGRSLSRSVAAGYYWTEHLKTVVEVGWTGDGELYAEHPDTSPSQQTYGWANHVYSTSNVAVAQRYQFGHNALFHPDLAAGAIVEWVDHSGELGPLFGRNGNAIQPRRPIPRSTDRRYRAFVASGFKAYMSERVFLRSDLRVAFERELVHVLLNTGIGIDF
jgi:hypothetical protein